MKTKVRKPVVISMGSVAASGGYYIAAAGSYVMANPGTITGSIGVISYFPDLREIFEKIGYSTTVIKSGKFKDIGNPGRALTDEERALLQGTIDETYGQFVRDIAVARSMDEAKIREFADGRIIVGESALKLGLVDGLGNFEDAVTKAAQLGKILGDPELIYAKKKRSSLLEFIIGGDMSEKLNSVLSETPNPLRYQLLF
jgi:protease-4